MSERARTDAQLREATRVLHLALGRDPDRALDRCSKEEFESCNAHARKVSEYHLQRHDDLQKAKAEAKEEALAYEKYKADIAKYKTGPKQLQQ